MSENIYIKFKDNSQECVTLTFDTPLEVTNQFGNVQYVYGIKEQITGEKKFSATVKLHEKIQALGVREGDSIYITKVQKDDVNNGYSFFKAELPPNQPQKIVNDSDTPPTHKSIEKFEAQFKKPEEKLDDHELSLRVEALEKDVQILKSKVIQF
mgnify:CR=1 FL=1